MSKKISGFGLTTHPHRDHAAQGRGIFKPDTDRLFLINHEEPPSDRAEYDRHKAIRQRLYDGIVDFQLAHRHIGVWNWRKFLALDRDTDGESEITRERDLRNGMAAAMALFYEIHHAKDWSFENTLRLAIEDAYRAGVMNREMPHKRVESVDFQVEAHEVEDYGVDLERVSQKLQENAELTDREVRFAAQQGWFEKLEEYFSKEPRHERARERTRKQVFEKMSFGEFSE